MSPAREVAGGGRAVRVAPARLAGWLDRFFDAHGAPQAHVHDTPVVDFLGDVRATSSVQMATQVQLQLSCPDGARLLITPPYLPCTLTGDLIRSLVDHATQSRTVGVVLIRRGAHSLGMVRDGVVLVSRTDRHRLQGRTAAGGWSQQRFARRRQGQATQALAAAADDVAQVLVPRVEELDAVVVGGDRGAARTVFADRRSAALGPLIRPWLLEVGEPRLAVLEHAAVAVMEIEIVIHDPTRALRP